MTWSNTPLLRLKGNNLCVKERILFSQSYQLLLARRNYVRDRQSHTVASYIRGPCCAMLCCLYLIYDVKRLRALRANNCPLRKWIISSYFAACNILITIKTKTKFKKYLISKVCPTSAFQCNDFNCKYRKNGQNLRF